VHSSSSPCGWRRTLAALAFGNVHAGAARRLPDFVGGASRRECAEESQMSKYIVAWVLGVPLTALIAIYLLF
jgi:hypothetical protein